MKFKYQVTNSAGYNLKPRVISVPTGAAWSVNYVHRLFCALKYINPKNPVVTVHYSLCEYVHNAAQYSMITNWLFPGISCTSIEKDVQL